MSWLQLFADSPAAAAKTAVEEAKTAVTEAADAHGEAQEAISEAEAAVVEAAGDPKITDDKFASLTQQLEKVRSQMADLEGRVDAWQSEIQKPGDSSPETGETQDNSAPVEIPVPAEATVQQQQPAESPLSRLWRSIW